MFRRIIFAFEINWNSTWLQFNTLKSFPKSFMVVADRFFRATTKRQREIQISLLAVMIWSNSVHPKHNLLAVLILTNKYNRNNIFGNCDMKTQYRYLPCGCAHPRQHRSTKPFQKRQSGKLSQTFFCNSWFILNKKNYLTIRLTTTLNK